MASLNLKPIATKLRAIGLAICMGLSVSNTARSEVNFDHNEIPNPEAISAYKRFWDAFESYENQKKRVAVEEYQRTREGLISLYSEKEKGSAEQRASTLENSISKYKENLEKTPNASNRPYVLLSLAQMYAELASIQNKDNPDLAKSTRASALNVLKSIEENHKTFVHNTDALYLRATILELNNEKESAKIIWNKLAHVGADKYTVYGNIVSGDHEFEGANPEKAIKFYEQAKGILSTLDGHDKGLDELRIYYRLAWANFKAGKNNEAIKAARHILTPGVLSKSVRQKDRIARDVADLVAFSLYENDNEAQSKATITSKDLLTLGGAISVVLMEQYITAKQPAKANHIAEFAANHFALAREYPDILRLKAKSEEQIGARSSRIETLEKLSMLLPQQSLWRHRHSNSPEIIKYMEELSRKSSESVASSYYEAGLASGNSKKFLMAANFYQILLDDQPALEMNAAIRLKIANCNFFADNLLEAEKRYNEIISSVKTSDEVLTMAHFQKVLTMEKMWRSSFESNVQKNIDPIPHPSTLAQLRKLEVAVDDHANKYPNQSRSIDLLLVAASANRDHNRFDEASKFWQRSLLSNPSQGQRAIAIRGLVFAKLRTGSSPEVIESVSNFLKLENKSTLGQNLEAELLGVLSSAANEYAIALSKKGSSVEASKLLLRLAKEFRSLPNREQLWRDGAYFAAISGNWDTAQQSAESYVKESNKKFAADMTYLVARSHEYQMRFNEAVKNYINLAERYPTHSRSNTALERAEKLATAEENFKLAAVAAKMSAERSKSDSEKLDAYDRAATYLVTAGDGEEALRISEIRKAHSSSTRDKLEAGINIAMIRYKTGDTQTAIDDLDSIEKQIERSKYDLGDSYKRLAAIANTHLGEHSLAQFKEMKLNESKGDISGQVDKKSKIFGDIAIRFDKVASLDQPKYSPKARFALAQAATDFADEINSISTRDGEPTTLKSQSRFNQNIARLRDMSKRYHGNNLLSKQRAPQSYAKNEWITRSAIALTKNPTANSADEVATKYNDQISNASSTEMPQLWSH